MLQKRSFLVVMNNLQLIVFLKAILLGVCACSGEDVIDILDVLEQEKKEIHAYLEKNSNTAVKRIPVYSKLGLLIDSLYIFNNNETGTVGQEGEYVLYDYEIKNLDGTYLENGSLDVENRGDSVRYMLGGPLIQRLDTGRFNYIGKAFQYIGEGNQGEMIVPSSLLRQGGNSWHYTLKALKVIPDVFEYEKQLIINYMSDPQIIDTFEYPSSAGSDTISYTLLYTTANNPHKIAPGDTLDIAITTFLLDGSGRQLRGFLPDTLTKQVFKANDFTPLALETGIQNLGEGDLADVLVPFFMAYGTTDYYHPNSKKHVMFPAYSTLGYRVEVLRVGIKEKEEEED